MTTGPRGKIVVVQEDDYSGKILVMLLLFVALAVGLIPAILLAAYGVRMVFSTTRTYQTWVRYGLLFFAANIALFLCRDVIRTAYYAYWDDIQLGIHGQTVLPILLRDYLFLVILLLPTALPLSAGCIVWRILLPYRTSDEWQRAYEALEASRRVSEEKAALRSSQQELSRKTPGLLYLATRIGKGDSVPSSSQSIGVHQQGQHIVCDESILNEHMFVLGATGAGKSQTLLRIMYEVLKNTTRDMIIIDGKGEREFAETVRSLIWLHRGHQTPIFSLGGDTDSAVYNGFVGHPSSIYNRLLKMIDGVQATAGAHYYADRNRDILQLICYAPAPYGPPRSFGELRKRLTRTWLLEAYKDDPLETHTITGWKDIDIEGLAVRLRPLIREFSPIINERGFDLETTPTAIFSIKTLAIGDTAQRFCRFFIEDMKDFVATRSLSSSRSGVLIIDEFGEFGNDNVRSLLSQARSKQWGVILATQEYANLGSEMAARQILTHTRTKIIMATDYPEEVGSLAGTRIQRDSGIQRGLEVPIGLVSDRVSHTFKVDMNWVRQASTGQAELIRQGHEVRVQIRQVVLSKAEHRVIADRISTFQQAHQATKTETERNQTPLKSQQTRPQYEVSAPPEEVRGTFKPRQRKEKKTIT